MNNLREVFLDEAQDLLEDLEEAFLELDDDRQNKDIVGRIFRAVHTIKGSGSMCGFNNLADFVHEFETMFDLVRKGQVAVTGDLVEIGLQSHKLMSEIIDNDDHISPTLRDANNKLLERLLTHAPEDLNALPESLTEEVEEDDRAARFYRINFVPHEDIFMYGANPLSLLKSLAMLGDCSFIGYTESIPPLDEIDPATCYLSWDIIIETTELESAIIENFEFVKNESDLHISLIDGDSEYDEDYKRIGEILVDRGDLSKEEVEAIFAGKPLAGELIAQSGLLPQASIDAAIVEQERVRKTQTERKQKSASDNIRVSSSRIDAQMDLVGELVITLASLHDVTAESTNSKLNAIVEKLDSLVTGIRDNVLGIRMLTIGTTFSKFKRLVRDLSAEQNKQIELVTEGADTELDKTVIDQLNDPLVHLIRNSLDHGIELPEDRAEANKPEKGTIRLAAKHAQGHVLIEINDDGKGIDPDVVWAKAVENKITDANNRPSDEEVLQYIFEPGFSTAKEITNISGRGVGMDVVKRSIEALRGSILLSSELGVGTTFTLQLPLTLAIIDGLLVKVGSESLVIPLAMIVECVETKKESLSSSKGGQMIRVRDSLIPCIPLQNWVGNQPDLSEEVQIIIVSIDDQQYGLIVNDVVGQQQIVIKSLGNVYKTIEGVSGATILGDGSVALILDVPQLISLFNVGKGEIDVAEELGE